jgi:hypothetical protein
MSNFICDQCGKEIFDSPDGYVTGCGHYPIEVTQSENKDEICQNVPAAQ